MSVTVKPRTKSASIRITDDDGMVAVRVTFGGRFDRSSAAHQHAALIIKILDQIADGDKQGDPTPQVIRDAVEAMYTPASKLIPRSLIIQH